METEEDMRPVTNPPNAFTPKKEAMTPEEAVTEVVNKIVDPKIDALMEILREMGVVLQEQQQRIAWLLDRPGTSEPWEEEQERYRANVVTEAARLGVSAGEIVRVRKAMGAQVIEGPMPANFSATGTDVIFTDSTTDAT